MAALGVQDSSSLHDYWQIRYPEQEKRPGIHVAGATEPAWWDAVERRLEGLMQLGPNWDSRGSRPANLGDVFAAVQFLTEVMRPETAVPWIGPLSSGGIQLAWKHGDVEVEAVFDQSRGEQELLVAVGENEWEEPIQAAASLFATVVERLSAVEYAA